MKLEKQRRYFSYLLVFVSGFIFSGVSHLIGYREIIGDVLSFYIFLNGCYLVVLELEKLKKRKDMKK